ncbi:hypothetical protein LJU32_15595 [Pseudomonas sp. B21_DOA]|nr:hypothetical protein LJU32_15595 [Pseudomonas sp. B21_DOA]
MKVTLHASLRPEIWPAVVLLLLASLITTGCTRSHSPKPVERDLCLDAGPEHTTAYAKCVSERKERQAEALKILLSDDPADNPQRQVAVPGDSDFQPSDFPDEPMPASFRMSSNLNLKDAQAFAYKTRISWKYVPDHFLPSPKEYARMKQMERLIQAAVATDGSAKWGARSLEDNAWSGFSTRWTTRPLSAVCRQLWRRPGLIRSSSAAVNRQMSVLRCRMPSKLD